MNLPEIKLFRDKLEPGEVQKPVVVYMNRFSLVGHFLLACLLILFMESCSRHSVPEAFSWAFGAPLVFLCNVLLVWASFLLVYLFRCRVLMRTAISIFWMALGIVNGILLAKRVTPLTFADLSLLSDLVDMSSSKYVTLPMVIGIIVAVVVIIALLVFILKKGPKFKGRLCRPISLIIFLAMVIAMPYIMKSAIHAGVLAGYFGNVAQGYKEYGLTYSFICGVVDNGMNESDEYSEQTVNRILDSTELKKTSFDEEDAPNIIFLQLETFMDPDEFNFLTYSEDPTPNYHKLMEEFGSGYLTVPVVGAGTSNTELECLTGMGIKFFGLGEYPYKTVLKNTAFDSSARVLKNLGYSTHVIHNNSASFYSRDIVFANMGFDSFTSKENMNIKKYNAYGTWPTDNILVSETEKTLDSTEGADYVYTITVQSHGSYPTEEIYADPDIKVTGSATEEENYQWTYYINQLHEVDEYIGKLLKMLENRDEKTLVVMYGDHIPTMNLTEDQMRSGDLFKTSYACWNNFGLETKDKDLASYQIMAYFMDKLGIHEGTFFRLQQYAMKEKDVDSKLFNQAWQILQYDALEGKHYATNGVAYEPSDMEFGVLDVELGTTDIKSSEGVMLLYGKNFTPWSKVYVNDSRIKTEFVSTTCLKVSLADLENGATIVVNQLSTQKNVLRTSNAIVYYQPDDLDLENMPEVEIEDTKESGIIEASTTKFNKKQDRIRVKQGREPLHADDEETEEEK